MKFSSLLFYAFFISLYFSNICGAFESKNNKSIEPDCSALLADADYLDGLYRRVRAPNYLANDKNCTKITSEIDNRFTSDWHQRRGVTPHRLQGEKHIMDSARTFGMSCVQIVFLFGCEGTDKLSKEFGPSILNDYNKDYRKFIADLRRECGRPPKKAAAVY